MCLKCAINIKQRLFISRNYNDTMNALEKFAEDMKKLDEISIHENEQKTQQLENYYNRNIKKKKKKKKTNLAKTK